MDFVAPLALAELRSSRGADQYSVAEIVVPRQLAQRLHAFKATLRSSGGLAILDHFDDVYSFLHHFKNVDQDLKEGYYEAMLRAVSVHASELR
ncbi:condensin complex subunit 1-like [Petromyzon marinus]|uniref:condensin complex subunit 1-like n=1 Tax=Petromyzon marinus TaxID=7757 RepID=UPI003F707B29